MLEVCFLSVSLAVTESKSFLLIAPVSISRNSRQMVVAFMAGLCPTNHERQAEDRTTCMYKSERHEKWKLVKLMKKKGEETS
jgi:hypothetical protein